MSRDLRLLAEALDRVSRPGEQAIFFETRMQAGQGDPSPALTPESRQSQV
jgi:hypothetical protein